MERSAGLLLDVYHGRLQERRTWVNTIQAHISSGLHDCVLWRHLASCKSATKRDAGATPSLCSHPSVFAQCFCFIESVLSELAVKLTYTCLHCHWLSPCLPWRWLIDTKDECVVNYLICQNQSLFQCPSGSDSAAIWYHNIVIVFIDCYLCLCLWECSLSQQPCLNELYFTQQKRFCTKSTGSIYYTWAVMCWCW